jgi:hypothetical protein
MAVHRPAGHQFHLGGRQVGEQSDLCEYVISGWGRSVVQWLM